MKRPINKQEFLERLAELAEARAIEVQIGILRKAAELAPAAAHALAVREMELRAKRMAVDPPVILCPNCSYE